MLSPYRVLDLTNEHGHLCGQILGDLGADVVQVEAPGGAAARRRGPFVDDTPHPDRSLSWWAFNRNKRSITLDLDTSDGQSTLRRLAAHADFLIESDTPGVHAARGLGPADLAGVNPRLVYVSITPFGQTGPKAQWAASDLVLMAAGGPLLLTGDSDRAPLRTSVPQAWLHGAAEAAGAAMIAHHERQRSGRGQHVDVSVQQAVALATQSYALAHAAGFMDAQRVSGGVRLGPWTVRFVFPAKDGHVSITFLFGASVGPFTRRLMQYVHEQGHCDAATRDKDWLGFFDRLMTGEESIPELERIKEAVAACTRTKTKAELLQLASERDLLIAPVATTAEVVASPQLAAREYWQTLAHPELGRSIRYPGPFARLGATPLRQHYRPPTVGEHDREIAALAAAPAARPAATAAPSTLPPDAAPLADLKVVDLMWAIAGPAATRVLADYGATVVRIESTTRTDICRTVAPYRDLPPGPESAVLFHNVNAGKHMMTLDLATEAGRAVFFDLVRWADVVTEAYTAGTMQALGLGYDTLRAMNPALIMLSTCLMGQTGPLAKYAGFGNLAAAYTGFGNLCGWPDRAPAGPFGAYTDYVAPRFTLATLLAALDHRRRTGEGQYIDVAQGEASIHFLAPAMLDYTVNGRVQTPVGNDDADAAPHGVYPAAGDDRWLAIAVRDDRDFAALAAVIGEPALRDDPRFATPADRQREKLALDALIGAWTAGQDALSAEAALQAAGIPAAVAATSADLAADPQLVHREHIRQVTHPDYGTTPIEGSRFRLSRTPAVIPTAAPTLGRDNQLVLETILGYDEARITELVIAGALG